MADYAIGDVQGCYDPLLRLLDKLDFNERQDRLWFVGDLVNRGPQSLDVLRFIKQLPLKPKICLGNHDLHLLASMQGLPHRQAQDDTLEAILKAAEVEELSFWLRQQALLHYDQQLKLVMVHAGIAPSWTLPAALAYAREVETILRSDDYGLYLAAMYGNEPAAWSEELTGMARYRSITNYFTRMRFCDAEGALRLDYKGGLLNSPPGLIPWFAVPNRQLLDLDIVFGHWAALQARELGPHLFAIDSGCLWGGPLTALRLQDRQRFTVPGLK